MELNNNKQPLPEFAPEEMKMPAASAPAPQKPTPRWLAPTLAVLIIVLLLLLAGLYIWSTTLTSAPTPDSAALRPTPAENNEPESTTAEANVESLQTVSTSDEIGAIEADIEATHLDQVETDLNAIDAEIAPAE